MDITTLFKASVQTVRLRNKSLDVSYETKSPLKVTKQSALLLKARNVVAQISKLRELLLENRTAYLNFSNYLALKQHMTDLERDQMDAGALEIMTTCSHLVKELKREVADLDCSQQNLEHREVMVSLIEQYLRNVCKSFSELKAIREKRAGGIRKVAKLEPESRQFEDVGVKSGKSTLNVICRPEETGINSDSNDSSPMKIQEINGDVNNLPYEEEPSPEDIQMFESENEQLFNEMNSLTEEVRQIESKVVHIAQLQEIFTEKILEQDKDLDRVAMTVVGSTENVKDANEQIRQAIQRNAGLRVWILFFLLVMSFSLLFLDWYNA